MVSFLLFRFHMEGGLQRWTVVLPWQNCLIYWLTVMLASHIGWWPRQRFVSHNIFTVHRRLSFCNIFQDAFSFHLHWRSLLDHLNISLKKFTSISISIQKSSTRLKLKICWAWPSSALACCLHFFLPYYSFKIHVVYVSIKFFRTYFIKLYGKFMDVWNCKMSFISNTREICKWTLLTLPYGADFQFIYSVTVLVVLLFGMRMFLGCDN